MKALYVRPHPHDGRLLGWEASLANYAMTEIAKAGTQRALVSVHSQTSKPCLLFSTGNKVNVLVVAAYDVFPNFDLKAIARQRYDLLLEDWETHCAAFVVAEFWVQPQPRFACLNSGATIEAADELTASWCSEFPALDSIDKATGSSLVRSCPKPSLMLNFETHGM